MSFIQSKDFSSTSFTQQSSKNRNTSTILNISKFTRSTTSGYPTTPSSSQGNMTGKLSRLSQKLQQLNSTLSIESLKVKEANKLQKELDRKLKDLVEAKVLKVKISAQELTSVCKLIKMQETRRTEALNEQCSELKESQKKMKDKFSKMKSRIEAMENVLGYDSAIDRFMS